MTENNEPVKTEEKEEVKETSTDDSEKGNKPKATSPLEQANTLNKELGTKLRRYEELIARQEELMANELIRGKSEANMDSEEKKRTPKEYAEGIMQGKNEQTK